MKMITSSLIAVIALGLVSTASAGQPHMQAAIDHLEAAKAELQLAEADKGGWRVQAIKTINDAIAQVKAGKGAGRR
jgi:hypothetical protein